LLKILGSHPVVFDPKLFLIRNVLAGRQKGADLGDVPANDLHWLAEEQAHRTSLKAGVPFVAWLRYVFAGKFIQTGDDLRNHNMSIGSTFPFHEREFYGSRLHHFQVDRP